MRHAAPKALESFRLKADSVAGVMTKEYFPQHLTYQAGQKTVSKIWIGDGPSLFKEQQFNQTDRSSFLVQLEAEVDKFGNELQRTYAKRALNVGSRASYILPRVYESPEKGIVLQTSADRGTVNLIFEGEQAILIRAGDEVLLQMNCSLSNLTISELLDTYRTELVRVSQG